MSRVYEQRFGSNGLLSGQKSGAGHSAAAMNVSMFAFYIFWG
jgi:hypothetical protein